MFPKFQYVRSKRLLCAARSIPCQLCGSDDGTVVAAHSNQSVHGKGKSVKSSDVFIASLCHKCHMEIDQGSTLTEAERATQWNKAHAKTFRELLARGLWPVDVPFPEIDTSLLGRYEG
jgi:hypothetical protein